jgi:hypothetical protein
MDSSKGSGGTLVLGYDLAEEGDYTAIVVCHSEQGVVFTQEDPMPREEMVTRFVDLIRVYRPRAVRVRIGSSEEEHSISAETVVQLAEGHLGVEELLGST